MNSWFRFYESVLDDPKVQLLPPDLFKFWVNCLCLTCRNDGFIPDFESVSFAFRIPLNSVKSSFQVLKKMGLIDERRGVMSPHNWHKRQFKSDVSTSRVQQYRKRQRNVSPPGNETPPDTDTEQIQNRADTETENTYTAHGEFGQVELTKTEYEKLKAKMNGSLEDYINRLDRYSQTHSAKFHKYQSHYAVILNWYDRDVKEGRVKPLVSSRPSEEEIERERQVQFGGRKKPL